MPGVIWIAKNSHSAEPKESIAFDKTHYFYWERQVFPPHFAEIKTYFDHIGKEIERKGLGSANSIPAAIGDYEPVFCNIDGRPLLISRLHYHIAIIWTTPAICRNKPVVSFLVGPHTPIIKSNDCSINTWKMFERMKIETRNMNAIQRAWFLGVYSRFLVTLGQFIARFQPSDTCNLVDYVSINREIPEEVKFDFKKTLFYFFVGKGTLPQKCELPSELGEILFGC